MRKIQYFSFFSILLITSTMGCIDPNPGAYINGADVQIHINSLEVEKYNQDTLNKTCLAQGFSIVDSLFDKDGLRITLEKTKNGDEFEFSIHGPVNSTTGRPMNISETDKSYYYLFVGVLDPKEQIKRHDNSRIDGIKDELKTEVTKFFTAVKFTVDWNNVTINA